MDHPEWFEELAEVAGRFDGHVTVGSHIEVAKFVQALIDKEVQACMESWRTN